MIDQTVTSQPTHDLLFLQWLKDECKYLDIHILPGFRWAAVKPMMFTHALIVGKIGDRIGYDDRWCYSDYTAAYAALEAWNGSGEPQGWTRRPATGRRISVDPNECDSYGVPVGAVAVMYYRN